MLHSHFYVVFIFHPMLEHFKLKLTNCTKKYFFCMQRSVILNCTFLHKL